MATRSPRASAFSFAHLLGGHTPRAAKAEDETDPKDKKKDDEARKSKKAKAEDADDEIIDENAAPPADDEGVDGDETPDLGDVEDPDDSIDEDAAPEEDDVDPKMQKAAKSGRKAERSRWSKVLAHSSAAGRVPTACQLLSTTTMSARAIVGTLKTVPTEEAAPAARGNLRDRMAARPATRVGADAPAGGGPKDFGGEVMAALNKVRPA